MYRYSPHMRGANDSGAQVRRRFHSVLTLLLLVAVIGLGIFGGKAMKYQSSAHDLFVRKLQVECGAAIMQHPVPHGRLRLIQHAGQDSPAYLQYADH